MDRWYRVNKKRPCAVCRRSDWCTYSGDAICCMRVQSEKQMRNGGWLHKTDSPVPLVPPIKKAIEDPPLDAVGTWRRWFDRTDYRRIDGLGMSLGVDSDALRAIGCAWAPEHSAWSFPMKNAQGDVIGIRLRSEQGRKWAVKGSRQGMFIPDEYPYCIDDATLYLVEGPTDLAAAMTLGLYAVGRPACLGQEEMLIEFLSRQKVRRIAIITDNDQPDQLGRMAGLSGAERLQKALSIMSCIWLPPCKDIREFLNAGGNALMIESCISDLVWTKPQRVAA